MGINFNNNKNNQFSLNTSKLNQSKALNNSNKIADTKASAAAYESSSLNSATLKSNLGTKFDSNLFGNKLSDVIPNEPSKPQYAEESGEKKKSFWQRLKDNLKHANDNPQDVHHMENCDNEYAAAGTALWNFGAAVVKTIQGN